MDMKRLVAMTMAVGAAVAAVAMPTKAELRKAQEMVNDVTEADVAALKAKSKTPAEVAAKHMELATQAGSEAEKYLLLQGAFKLYAKAGDYEGAANALGTMNREIAGMKPEVIVEIYNKAIFSSMKEKAPKLHAIKEAARRQVTYRKLLAKAEAAVKANPKDAAAQKKLGECHAELGDWSKALDAFVLAGGDLAKTAKAELDGTAAPQVSGDFWWDYESGDEMSTYKLHAAALYRTALADDSFKGLARTRADQRVKETEEVAGDLPAVAPVVKAGSSKVNLSAPKIEMVDGRPASLKFSLSKDVEIELLGCPAGEFTMGDEARPETARPHHVRITRPFWLGRFPVLRKEWMAIIGKRELTPIERALGGDDAVSDRMALKDILKFCRKLTDINKRKLPKGYVFRLPTEAEWEYASRANGTEVREGVGLFHPLRRKMQEAAKVPWDDLFLRTSVKAGLCPANNWGFYDFYGNCMEIVLDEFCVKAGDSNVKLKNYIVVESIDYPDEAVDPVALPSKKAPTIHLARGWDMDKNWVNTGDNGDLRRGFRVCLGPDLVAEKKAKGPDVEERVDVVDAGKPVLTAGKAPTPKCKMVNGRPASLKFELAKGVDLELEGCPAGKFTMGYAAGMWNNDGKAAPKHEVTITRPFWIGKFQVTRGQAKAVEVSPKDKFLDVQSAFDGKGGDTCSAVMTFEDMNDFCRKLTEKFAAEIPTGYVFRLASNAEWEYASKAGNYSEKNPAMLYSGHKESPYVLTRHDKLELLKKKNIEWKDSPVVLPSFPGGLKRPNGWGIFDMLGNHPEVTLDQIPKNAPEVVSYGEGKESGIIRAITYAKQETDPILYCESDWNLLVRGRWDNYLLMEGVSANRIQYVGGFGYAFRVCLGPDLVAEKKAKK